ncbi:MAG: hypothetical protein NUV93_04670 [Firmicutes bacterium]|jgi:hypothetical protein|nr:hypothetical protein [Bacillota bacterium]
MIGTEPRERRSLLTARQVGLIAAFGGLGFAWRALGLVIPLYPPFVLDIRETAIVLAAFAGGPWVGLCTGILIGLPSAIPVMDIIYYPAIALTFCLFVKKIWQLKGIARYALAIVSLVGIEYLIGLPISAYVISLFGLAPFKPFLITSWVGGTGYVYCAQMVIPLLLALELAPGFMKPRWSWRGGEEIEEEVAA